MKCHDIYYKCHLHEFFVAVASLAKGEISFDNYFNRNIACFLKIDFKQAQIGLFKKFIEPTVVAVFMYLLTSARS